MNTPASEPPVGFTIVRASARDIGRMQPLFHALDRFHQEARPDIFVPIPGAPRDEQWLQGILDSRDAAIFLAVADDGEPIGLAVFIGRRTPARPPHADRLVVDLDNIIVLERWRHQSIAHSLIAAGRAFARDIGAQVMSVGVYAFNTPALRCYEAAGFAPILHRLEAPIEALPA